LIEYNNEQLYTIVEVFMQTLKDSIKKDILTAAAKHFRYQGYAQASLRHIAKHANISVGNVYRYFESKDVLFEAVIFEPKQKLNQILNLEASAYDHPQLAFSVLVDSFSQMLITLIQENEDALFVTLSHSLTAEQIKNQLNVFLKRLAMSWAENMNLESQDQNLLINMLSSGIFHGLLRAVESAHEVDDETLRLAITQYFQLHAYMTYAIKEEKS